MLRASYIFGAAALALALGAVAAVGCSGDPLKAPRSDTQYDDPDDPGTGGVVGAADATTRDARSNDDAGPGDASAAADASD